MLDEKSFKRLSEFIHSTCGIKLPPEKKTMLEARLQKRLKSLGLQRFCDYGEYLFSRKGLEEELPLLVNVVTTNTTDFFREPRHFELMFSQVLPEWVKARRGKEYRVWSAGCSSGEEPYTLAMVLSEFALVASGFRHSILGTDISTNVLEKAARAVYPVDKVEPVPASFKKRYLLRSKDRSEGLVRIAPELRRQVSFRQLNFMEDFSMPERMDAIFFRNVMIYFDRPTQERILTKLHAQLAPGGHLFIGHSESLAGMSLPLVQIAPTVYRRAR
jgi:chemotaxis protein methyltransferase CheR